MNHLFLGMFLLGLRFIAQPVRILRQWGSAAGDFAPTINERLSWGAPGKSDAELNTEHERAMAVPVVANPKLGTRRLIQTMVGISMTHFARNPGFGEFLADIGDLVVVG